MIFSKQLEYSYLMYEYIKKNASRHVGAEEIIKATKVPKRWGRTLLCHMATRMIIDSTKGKGYCYIEREISFWEFYILVEPSTVWLNLNKIYGNECEKKYGDIISRVETKLHQEMQDITI